MGKQKKSAQSKPEAAATPPDANAAGDHQTPANKKSFAKKYPRWMYPAAAATALASGGIAELQTSFLQSRFFGGMAEGKLFATRRTSGPDSAAPASGPYDERLGYTRSLEFRERMTSRGYSVNGETQWYDRSLLGLQLYPIYNEKSQAGLRITDDNNNTVYDASYPRRSYENFREIPTLLSHSLLFVENRELVKDHARTWNPAVEWVRLVNAFVGQGLRAVGISQDRAGGSTLATQIEKFRHSPGGITGSPVDKLRQMLTASVRAYDNGPDTRAARENIILHYLNSMPLSAYPGFGEVNGFADGMSLWFGADMNDVNRLMKTPDAQLSEAELQRKAVAYRQSLSLVMAVKKPSAYLLRDRAELDARVNSYLPLLAEAGIISPQMRDRVLATRLEFTDPRTHERNNPAPPSKPVQALRVDLLQSLNVRDMYDLNRLDLTAVTTLDGAANVAVTNKLRSLNDPAVAASYGLTGFRLLQPSMTDNVIYSFTLYERMPDGTNALRVQTDSFDGPLNMNEGTKLELGSTAKLRTMITYLQVFAEIHAKHGNKTPEQLAAVQANDALTRWGIEYLSNPANDRSLNGILEGALNRTYSGNPGESFYTGGGVHHFNNFDGSENGRSFTVKQALHNSVNLPFIRMMRDISNYMQAEKMHIDPAVFTDPNNAVRRQYLERFAHTEGQTFMWRAWVDQRSKKPAELAAHLAEKTRRSPVQLAVLYRSLHPNDSLQQMETFIRANCTSCTPNTDFQRLYDTYGKDKFNLNDRGYLTRIHPLALWIAEQRVANPAFTWDQAVANSTNERLEVYQWLLRSNNMGGQNNRIRTMIEQDAFKHIHGYWKQIGFPFDSMVPSYASALGASGDTPAALADMAGIIQQDGLRRAPIRFSEITLAANTPYELNLVRNPTAQTRVLPVEIARLVRREMVGVVEQGSARRAFESVTLSDGTILPLGGKTGTGDNRQQTFSAGGALTSNNARSRTATFVFVIDDRFYGCITAYVEGPEAAQYRFTSSLASQIFKTLVPDIRPILDRSYQAHPRAPQVEAAPPAPVSPPPAATPVAANSNSPVRVAELAPSPRPAEQAPAPRPAQTAETAQARPAQPEQRPAAPPSQTPATTSEPEASLPPQTPPAPPATEKPAPAIVPPRPQAPPAA